MEELIKSFFKNKIIIFNFIILFILFCIAFIHNQYVTVAGHDFIYPYTKNILDVTYDSFEWSGIVQILNGFYNYVFAHWLNMHPLDFRANIFVCSFISILFILTVIIFSQSFYLFYNGDKKFLFRKENLFLIPCVFFLFAAVPDFFNIIHLVSDKETEIFIGHKDSIVYIEYMGAFIMYCPFFLSIFNIILFDKEFNQKEKYIFFFVSMCVGCFSEFINVNTFFSLVLILLFLWFFKKSKLKSPSLIIQLIGFCVGLFIMYVLTGKLGVNEIGSLGNYNIAENLNENFSQINNFNKEYLEWLIKDKIVLFIIIFLVSLAIKLSDKIKTVVKYTEKENSLMFLCFSLIAGYFIMSYLLIFFANGRDVYIFQEKSAPLVEYYILIFVLFIFTGFLYYKYGVKSKKIITSLLVIILAASIYNFIPKYIYSIKDNYKTKKQLYEFDKKMIVASVFGESLVLDKPPFQFYFDNSEIYEDPNLIYGNVETIGCYYCKANYKHQVLGVKYNEKNVDKSYKRQLELLGGDVKDKYNLFNQIKFSSLKKFDSKVLTLDDIKEMEIKYGKDETLLKAEAYVNYTNENYDEAEKLYKQYLKKNPDDFDALINLGEIYKIKNNKKEAISVYNKLLKLDKTNPFFMFELANIYYKSGEYNKALEYCFEMIEVDHNPQHNPYICLDIAIIYKALNKEDDVVDFLQRIEHLIHFKKEDINSFINNPKPEELIKPKEITDEYKLHVRDVIKQFYNIVNADI